VGANVFTQVNPISFTMLAGAANPLPQTVEMSSTGANFNFSVAANTGNGGSWLTVSTAGGCEVCSTPYSIIATINASPTLAAGTYTGQIVATAQTGFMSVTIPVTLIVTSNTTTAVTSSVNPSVFGQAVTFTATISPVAPGTGFPTGTVSFFDGANPITCTAPGTLASGVATCTTSSLPVASHTITTSYGGDGNFIGSAGSLIGNPEVIAANVSSSVSVTSNGLSYNKIKQQGTETVTVKNTSAKTISGPVELVLGLSAGVTAVNNAGTFNGNPYWTVTAGSIAPGASAQVTVTLGYTSGTTVSTSSSVYSGSIP
jgi:hypothetical protein